MKKAGTKEQFLVNAITALRIPLTGMGIVSLYQYGQNGNSQSVTFFMVISISIYFTDFLDGHLARGWSVCSDSGARLDLFCDSFYIFSCLLTLTWIKVSSPWILLIALYKLLEFIAVSKVNRRFSRENTFYFYDKIGRVLSGLFYMTPPMLLLLHDKVPLFWGSILERYTMVLFGIAIISSWAKLGNIKKSLVRE